MIIIIVFIIHLSTLKFEPAPHELVFPKVHTLLQRKIQFAETSMGKFPR
jgi:hypothetical protein